MPPVERRSENAVVSTVRSPAQNTTRTGELRLAPSNASRAMKPKPCRRWRRCRAARTDPASPAACRASGARPAPLRRRVHRDAEHQPRELGAIGLQDRVRASRGSCVTLAGGAFDQVERLAAGVAGQAAAERRRVDAQVAVGQQDADLDGGRDQPAVLPGKRDRPLKRIARSSATPPGPPKTAIARRGQQLRVLTSRMATTSKMALSWASRPEPATARQRRDDGAARASRACAFMGRHYRLAFVRHPFFVVAAAAGVRAPRRQRARAREHHRRVRQRPRARRRRPRARRPPLARRRRRRAPRSAAGSHDRAARADRGAHGGGAAARGRADAGRGARRATAISGSSSR